MRFALPAIVPPLLAAYPEIRLEVIAVAPSAVRLSAVHSEILLSESTRSHLRCSARVWGLLAARLEAIADQKLLTVPQREHRVLTSQGFIAAAALYAACLSSFVTGASTFSETSQDKHGLPSLSRAFSITIADMRSCCFRR
jgi:hypothetical protein